MKKTFIHLFFVTIALFFCTLASAQKTKTMYYNNGKIYSKHLYDVYYSTPLTDYEIDENLYNKSPLLFHQYHQGLALKNVGAVCLGVGVPATVASLIIIPITYANRYYYRGYYFYDKKMYQAGWSLFGIGVGLTSIGIPIYSVGLHKIKDSIKAYNEKASLTFLIKDNGLGLRFNL